MLLEFLGNSKTEYSDRFAETLFALNLEKGTFVNNRWHFEDFDIAKVSLAICV